MTHELDAQIFHCVEQKIGDKWVDFTHGLFSITYYSCTIQKNLNNHKFCDAFCDFSRPATKLPFSSASYPQLNTRSNGTVFHSRHTTKTRACGFCITHPSDGWRQIPMCLPGPVFRSSRSTATCDWKSRPRPLHQISIWPSFKRSQSKEEAVASERIEAVYIPPCSW